MFKRSFSVLVIFVVFLSFSSAATALSKKWNVSGYTDTSPAALLEASWSTYSYAEKKYLRSYLAYKYPNKPEGMFARAWVASLEGDAKRSKNL